MLGTNDMKHRFSALPCDVAYGAGELVQLVQRYPYGNAYPIPKVLLIAPIWLGEHIEDSPCTGFSHEAHAVSKQLAPWFEKQAQAHGCLFLDAAKIAGPSAKDQLHMEEDGHRALAEAVAALIQRELR